MKYSFAMFTMLVASLFFTACGPQSSAGGMHVNISSNALSTADVTSVVINYNQTSGGSYGTVTVTPSEGAFTAIVSPLPAGTYSITANAKNASNSVVYTGTTSAVVTTGATTLVAMMLQQSASSINNETYAPSISAVTFNPMNPVPNQPVTASVSASGGLAGPLTYLWSATCAGSTNITFSNATSYSTTITSDCTTSMVVSVSVSNTGYTASVSTTLSYSVQGAQIAITFNTYPVIVNYTTNDGQIAPGQSTAFAVVANDPDGDPLTYAWTLPTTGTYACSGAVLTNANSANPSLTAPAELPSNGRCEVDLVVTDGRGGRATGLVTFTVANLN
jgi:hypothetical protein